MQLEICFRLKTLQPAGLNIFQTCKVTIYNTKVMGTVLIVRLIECSEIITHDSNIHNTVTLQRPFGYFHFFIFTCVSRFSTLFHMQMYLTEDCFS